MVLGVDQSTWRGSVMSLPASTHTGVALPSFAGRVFERLPRADQRRWARVYLKSLLSTPGKKSVRRLAAAVSDSPTASQSLHQFVNASTWDWSPVRGEVTRWAEEMMGTPQAWAIDLAVLRKRGEHSCGVHRRFMPSTGRSVTCQLGVGAFLATDLAAVPADWRLLLPGSWATDAERRARTRIPDDIGARSLERHALDLVDGLVRECRNTALPIVADLGAGSDAGALLRGLARRNRDCVVAVPDGLQVQLGPRLRMSHQGAGDAGPALAARSLLDYGAVGPARSEVVALGGGRQAVVTSSVVRLAGPTPAIPQLPRAYRLFSVRPEGARRPGRLWITNLSHARAEKLAHLTQLLSRTGETVRQLKCGFGLLDFEGRSYPGWHHHMTLVSAAYAYHRLAVRPEALLAAM